MEDKKEGNVDVSESQYKDVSDVLMGEMLDTLENKSVNTTQKNTTTNTTNTADEQQIQPNNNTIDNENKQTSTIENDTNNKDNMEENGVSPPQPIVPELPVVQGSAKSNDDGEQKQMSDNQVAADTRDLEETQSLEKSMEIFVPRNADLTTKKQTAAAEVTGGADDKLLPALPIVEENTDAALQESVVNTDDDNPPVTPNVGDENLEDVALRNTVENKVLGDDACDLVGQPVDNLMDNELTGDNHPEAPSITTPLTLTYETESDDDDAIGKKKTKKSAESATAKTYPKRKNKKRGVSATPLKQGARITRSSAAAKTTQIKDKGQSAEIDFLRNEVTTLRNAVAVLQDGLKAQQREMADLLQKVATIPPQTSDTHDVYTNMEKSFTTKSKVLEEQLTVRIDSVSKTATAAINMSETLKNNPRCPHSDLVQQMAVNMDRLDHVVAGVQQQMEDDEKNQVTKKTGGDDEAEKSSESTPLADQNDVSKDATAEDVNNENLNTRSMRKILMFMDSNQRFLDETRLWKNLTMRQVGDIPDLHKAMMKHKLDEFDVVIIHVGVNDIDATTGKTVAQKLIHVTSKIKKAAPGIKIILSEVTPRKTKDEEVQTCNKELREILKVAENITLVKHDNLRNEEWTHHRDERHITESSTARLAGNLKSAFRKAIGATTRKNAPLYRSSNRYQRGNERGAGGDSRPHDGRNRHDNQRQYRQSPGRRGYGDRQRHEGSGRYQRDGRTGNDWSDLKSFLRDELPRILSK